MAGAHASHVAALANAIKANGVVVRLDPPEWLKVLKRTESPLIVIARGGVFRRSYRYLTAYRGLAFYTTSEQPLVLPGRAELISAKSLSIPDI
jgi:hypothetical protein